MTTDEIIVQLDYRKDFATDAQKEALDEAIKAVKRGPSTNADRPKAHWRKTALGTQCSFCLGFALFRVSASGEKEIESAFCPHCGADMRGGKE